MPPDLYTQWLLIPPGPRPPNYYVLLGLSPFCSSAQQIEEAAGRQLERLDRYALHPDLTTREACQRMMNEVARARVMLVSTDKRRKYDEELLSHGFQLEASAPAKPPVEHGVRGVAEIVDHEPHDEDAHAEEGALDPIAEAARAHAGANAAAQEELHPELAQAAQTAQFNRIQRVRHPGRGIALAAAGLIVAGGIGFMALRHFRGVMSKNGGTLATTEPKPVPQPSGVAVTEPPHVQEVAVVPKHLHPKPAEHPDVVPPDLAPVPEPANPAVATTENTADNKGPEFFGVRGRPDSPGVVERPTPSKPPEPAKPDKTPKPVPVATTTPAAVPAVVASNESKVAIPSAAAQQAAGKAVEEAFKADLAGASGRDAAIALSQRLLEAGIEKQGDPAARYALFCKARDLAQQAGDVDAALAAVNQMESNFVVDGVKMKSDVVLAVVSGVKTGDDRRSVARQAIPLIDEAIYLDRYDVARSVADAALVAAREGNDWAAARDIVVRVLEIRSGLSAYADYRKAMATLAATPNDPAANLVAGLYACIWKSDWKRGLSLLAQGKDAFLKELAQREIAGFADAGAQVQAADDWWQYGEKQESIARQKIRAHAGFWYRQALPGLEGLVRDRVERRLAAIGRMAVPDVSMATEGVSTGSVAAGPTLAQGPAAGIVPTPRVRPDVAPIPSADDQKEAAKEVMKLADGLKVPQGQDPRRTLAEHVWEAASGAARAEKSDPKDMPMQYILLLESVRLGTETSQLWMMSQAADLLSSHFAVDVMDLKFQALSRSNVPASGDWRLRQLVDGAGELRDESMERKEYATAFKFAGLADGLARRLPDPNAAAAVRAANAPLQDWPQVQAAIATLEGKPADPDANTIVGRFLCFIAGNWNEGLKNLAQGTDARLKSLAATELKNPSDADAQKAIADGWWDVAAQNPVGQMQLEWHAAQWYRQALPGLSASMQAVVTGRIRGLSRYNTQLPAIGDSQLKDDPRMPGSKATPLLTMETGAGSGGYTASFSLDGRRIIALGRDRFWVWDSTTGDAAGPPTMVCEPSQNSQSRTAFLDSSGTRVVALGGDGKRVTVWDVAEQKQIGTTIRKDDMVDADISPDGRMVVTANGWSPAAARLWDLNTGKRVGAEMPCRQRITCVRFSADGKYVLTAGADRSCQVWNALNGAPVSQLGAVKAGDEPQLASFDPSGKFVGLLFRDGAAVIWETASGRSLLQLDCGTAGQGMLFSPNGLYMACGGPDRHQFSHAATASAAVQIFDLTNGRSLAGLLKHDGGGNDVQGGLSMSFSHDNRYLVTSSPFGRTARVWDIKKGATLVVAPLEHLQTVTSVGFDLPARHVVTACADGTVRVWELPG